MLKKIRFWLMQVVGISKTETNGLLILIPIVITIFLLPGYYKLTNSHGYNNQVEDSIILEQLLSQLKQSKKQTFEKEDILIALRPFDPNSATEQELISNGISKQLAQRIINYRSKGGRFAKKKDLLKIYGLSDSLYNALSYYLLLPDKALNKKLASGEDSNKSKRKTTIPVMAKFELNTADTSAFKKIRGIGSVLSARIVKYRDMLGGFTSTNQLYEVYGLKDEVISKLLEHSYLESNTKVHKIDVNKMDEYQLKQHPYISQPNAKAIVSYRFQHGDFSSLDDLSKIHLLDSSFISKVSPYLSFTSQ